MGDLSTEQQTMGLSVALVEMTILGEMEESNSKDNTGILPHSTSLRVRMTTFRDSQSSAPLLSRAVLR
jgi:hypothetical protein